MRGGMDEVELVEEDWDPPTTARTPDADAGPRRRPRPPNPLGRRIARRWWPVPIALIAVVVLADLATGSIEEREALAAQELPEVSAPVGPDVEVIDLADDDPRLWGGEVLAGVRVSTTWNENGEQTLIGSDLDSADRLWEYTIPLDLSNGGYASNDCWAEGALLSCWTTVSYYGQTGDVQSSQTRLLHLDPTTGELIETQSLEPGTTVNGDGDLRVTSTSITLRDPERVVAEGIDPTDGSVTGTRWEAELPALDTAVPWYPERSVQLTEHAVLVIGPTGGWVLDREDGHLLGSGMNVRAGRQDRFIVQNDGVLYALVDGESVELGTGEGLYLHADDGSAPGAEFLYNQFTGELTAVDTGTGEQLWVSEHPFRTGTSVVLLADMLIGAAPDGLLALDAETGQERWAVTLRATNEWSLLPVTDGRQVLTLVEEDGSTVLLALDRRTGTRLWATPMPDDSQQLTVVDHQLYLLRDSTSSLLS